MRPSAWVAAIGALVVGLTMLAGAGAWAALGNRGPTTDNPGRAVLWYPTGAAAGCAVTRRYRNCAAVPTGNINEGGRVVARGVMLKGDFADFRWTVSPDQVQAANERAQARYLRCVRSGRTGCAAPEYRVPSFTSGMATRWDPSFDAAYPPGIEGSRNVGILITLVVAGLAFTAGGVLGMRHGLYRRGR